MMKKAILIFILLFLTTACTVKNDDLDNDKIKIAVSILPQKEFVKSITMDKAEVKELIPPGGSPATYEPKPSDLIWIEESEVYFRIGEIPFEKANIDKFTDLNKEIIVVDTSENIKFRTIEAHSHDETHNDPSDEEHSHEEGQLDPHIWLSPRLVIEQVKIINHTLSEIDPENSVFYSENTKDYISELNDLDSYLESTMNTLSTKKFMVFHPAWGYFAEEYGLEQIAIERDGKEPTSSELQEFIDIVREEEIPVIFVQSQFNKGIAESISAETGAEIVSIDPLAENYIKNMKNIGETIKQSMQKETVVIQ